MGKYISNPSEQFAGMETWVTGGGAELLKSLPVTNSQQVDTWQWTVSQPASMTVGNCLLYTSPSPRDVEESRMPSSA